MCGPRPSCKRPLALHGRAGMPGPYIHTKQPPGFSTNPGGFVDKILCGVAYAFLIFSFALAAVSLAASFAAEASSRRRSMAVRVAASVSA